MADVTAVKTMNETDSLVFQCMDYTKQLASQGKAFKFSLSLPSGFNFSLDFSQEKLSPFRKPESKKQSPSTLRRNTQRRKDYLAKKAAEKQADHQHDELKATETELKCDHCGELFIANDILNKHIAEKHLAIETCDECELKTSLYENMTECKNDEQIEKLDGNSEIEQSDKEYEYECEERGHKQEEQCKAGRSLVL